MKPAFISALSAVCLLVMSTQLPAQFGGTGMEGTVSGTGDIVLERLPDTMRVQVAILGKASTLKEALDALKDRVEAAKVQLTSMGVDKDSIEVGSPKVTSGKSQQQEQMERMVRERLKRGGRKQPAAATKTPVVVSAELKAEWKLSAKTAEELLLATHPLQEKVKAADLAGAKEAAKVSAEEQEALEETENDFSGYPSRGEAKPGDPAFVFVAKFSDEELDKALADGYQKAKANAERVCKAAGLKLGPLSTIANNNSADVDYSGDMEYYGNSPAIYRSMQRSRRGGGADLAEAVGMQPDKVKFTVNVHAAFRIAEQK